jgi:hypothetical protein
MHKLITQKLRHFFLSLVIAVQAFSPAAVLAQEVSDVPPADSETSQSAEATSETTTTETVTSETVPAPETQTTTTSQSEQGPAQPTGASQSSYTYNDESGLWESDYYTWDPVTKQTKPKGEQTYSYNPTSGMWDTTEWYYSPEQGKYLANTTSTPNNPSTASLPLTSAPDSGNTISNTGPNSNNQIDLNGNTNATFDLFFDASISNKIGQMASTGNAYVQGNTYGGNATSGDATSMLNLLNMIQSSWGQLGSQDIALFMANINNDLAGDLVVDPSRVGAGSGNTNLDVTVSVDAAINNDIDVSVASGNAGVLHNTTGGNATSGDAQAVVNLLNLINSAITANKSFIGVLNIHGNLNGDILLPDSMMNAIIAATGPSSNNQINDSAATDIDLSIDDNKTIRNDINTDVSSGNAIVSGNTTGGNATSGSATSNVVLLNMTGQRVVAENALLVFVNVMGSWVGLIFDAPAGTNAVVATGPHSTNTINRSNDLMVDADITKNSLINNNIDVTAETGDATVSGNTTGGNATSGDASVGVNVLNMIDSQFDISDWFGVLFINVFGEWVGSFGVDTEAGEPALPVGGSGGDIPASAASNSNNGTFSFIPKEIATAARSVSSSQSNQQVVAGATTSPQSPVPPANVAVTTASSDNAGAESNSLARNNPNLWVAGLVTFTGLLLLGGERLITMFRGRLAA